jgi:hypothetical protein
MYRKLLVIASIAALAALAIGGGAFASTSTDGPPRVINLIEKTTSSNYVDLGAKGFSPGDEYMFASQFWNVDRTRQIGSNNGYCVVLSPQAQHCVGTAHLKGGTIEYAGSPGANGGTIAITGGTGIYREAEGQVVIHNLNSQGTLTHDVVQLAG